MGFRKEKEQRVIIKTDRLQLRPNFLARLANFLFLKNKQTKFSWLTVFKLFLFPLLARCQRTQRPSQRAGDGVSVQRECGDASCEKQRVRIKGFPGVEKGPFCSVNDWVCWCPCFFPCPLNKSSHLGLD